MTFGTRIIVNYVVGRTENDRTWFLKAWTIIPHFFYDLKILFFVENLLIWWANKTSLGICQGWTHYNESPSLKTVFFFIAHLFLNWNNTSRGFTSKLKVLMPICLFESRIRSCVWSFIKKKTCVTFCQQKLPTKTKKHHTLITEWRKGVSSPRTLKNSSSSTNRTCICCSTSFDG